MSDARTRVATWADPGLTTRGAAGRTGLAFLRAIIDGQVPPAPLQAVLGVDLVFADEGVARFQGLAGEHWYNPTSTVHGGVIATLLDSAMGACVMSVLDEKHGYTTVDLHVQMTRAVTERTGLVIAEGRVLHRGSRVVTAEGKLTDSTGKLLAHGATTCLVIERS